MKHLKVAGLCLVSMLMMSMALAGTASAQLLWLLCLEGTGSTKYSTNQCSTAASGGAWQWTELKGTDKVSITGLTLTLRDKKATGGSSAVQCSNGEGEGTIGPGNKGRITKAKIAEPKTGCLRVEGGCKAGEIEKVEGANLPWQVELFETEKSFQTHIEATTSGKEPGWVVECNSLLGKQKDTCTQEAGKPETVTLTNVNSGGVLLVLGKFLEKHKADCSQGGVEQGEVIGQIAILLASGQGLRIDT